MDDSAMCDTQPLRKSDLTRRLLVELIKQRDLPKLTEYISLAREIEMRLALSGRNKRCPMDWVNDEFVVIAKLGDIVTLRCMIKAGANVDAADINGRSVLIWSAIEGHSEGVTSLIEAGADVNAADILSGDTALIAAARHGARGNVVTVLIKAESHVDAVNKDGRTSLMWACRMGDLDVVKVLIEAGANVNAYTKSGTTATLLAACNGFTVIVQALIEAGADAINAVGNIVCNKQLCVTKQECSDLADLQRIAKNKYPEITMLLQEAGVIV